MYEAWYVPSTVGFRLRPPCVIREPFLIGKIDRCLSATAPTHPAGSAQKSPGAFTEESYTQERYGQTMKSCPVEGPIGNGIFRVRMADRTATSQCGNHRGFSHLCSVQQQSGTFFLSWLNRRPLKRRTSRFLCKPHPTYSTSIPLLLLYELAKPQHR